MLENANRAGWLHIIFGFLAALAVMVPIMQARATEMPDRPTDANTEKKEIRRESSRTVMILGISWHSGFCEGRSKAPECENQSTQRTDARQFSLHGLWTARKSYCGVPDALKEQDKKRKWLDMPELALDDALKVELAKAMPGMVSGLERHEWIKHGTCSGDVAADYYARSLKLLAAVNGSTVQALFEDHLGKALGEADIKEAFDEAFGEGAGAKIRMRCRKDGDRNVITGLTIGLGKVEDEDADLAMLIAAAGKTRFGCTEGIVDEAGLQ